MHFFDLVFSLFEFLLLIVLWRTRKRRKRMFFDDFGAESGNTGGFNRGGLLFNCFASFAAICMRFKTVMRGYLLKSYKTEFTRSIQMISFSLAPASNSSQ